MLLLNSALCSKDFRKVGIIHSSINLALQIICLITLTVYLFLVVGAWIGFLSAFEFLAVLDISLYSLLLYGLVNRKPQILLFWLSFAPLELIILETLLIYGVSAIVVSAPAGLGIVLTIIFVLISSYMFHNMCIIFTARHGFIRDQESQSRNLDYQLINTAASAPNSSAPPYEQCNPQHFEYNAKINQYVPCKCIYPHFAPNYQGTEIQRPDC